MNSDKIENIQSAFMHLSFAIRLSDYIQSNHINLDTFNSTDINVVEPNSLVIFSNEDFNQEYLWKHGEINILISFAIASMVLWHAIERRLTRINTEEEHILGLLYSIRNCFAHSPAEPKWHLKNPIYQTIFHVNGKEIDLTDKHEQVFNFEDIQGLETLFHIKNHVIKSLEKE